MRDTNRIFPMMNAIAAKWADKCPDWRFVQLMMNFISWLGRDPFYMEDEDFMKKFDEFMETL